MTSVGSAMATRWPAFRVSQLSSPLPCKASLTYDVRRAYDDKIFGDLTFRPAQPGSGEGIDEAIARETEAQFKQDRSTGLKHLVMVRVDGLDRGRELEKIYANTSLRLKFVSGQTALSTVKKTVDELKADKLDGIICVNMFGEGFDLPRLKIAALHSPHKSLAVTLQFIGRFARTNDPEIAGATFVAYPNEQRDEIHELWTTSAIWPDIVHNVSSLRIEKEEFAQQVFETFETQSANEVKDIPLGNLLRLYHCKASSEEQAGSRLLDLYDVCGQSIRSGIWIPGARLVDRLEYRLKHTSVAGIVRGTLEDLRRAFSASQRHSLRFEIFVVQPGVSASKLREMPEQLLVATKHAALAAGFAHFGIIGSA